MPPIRSTNACGNPSICTVKGLDPSEVHTHYILPSNSVATNDFNMSLVQAAALDKLDLCLNHKMAHLIMIIYYQTRETYFDIFTYKLFLIERKTISPLQPL